MTFSNVSPGIQALLESAKCVFDSATFRADGTVDMKLVEDLGERLDARMDEEILEG